MGFVTIALLECVCNCTVVSHSYGIQLMVELHYGQSLRGMEKMSYHCLNNEFLLIQLQVMVSSFRKHHPIMSL